MSAAPSLIARLRRALKRRFFLAPGRDRWQQPDRVVAALGLRPGDRIADLGAGPGYFSLRLARAVEPQGRVYAVDSDPDMLALVEAEARQAGSSNVVPVAAAPDRVELPEQVDLIFIANAYHHLPDRPRYLTSLAGLVDGGGRLAVVEPRPDGLFARLFGHATEPSLLRAELEAAGWELLEEVGFLPRHSFLILGRRAEAARGDRSTAEPPTHGRTPADRADRSAGR